MNRALLYLIGIVLVLSLVYLLGPRVSHGPLKANLPEIEQSLTALEDRVNRRERSNPQIKPDNEARIVWADSSKQKTPYSMVYLHGFGASQGEGEPVHRLLAKRFGCNLYLSRLKEQGINSDSAFKSMTAENLLASALEAVAIGQAIGDSVIVVGTSTGGALGIYITANNPEIAGLILYSPIIAPKDEALYLLNDPWGRVLGEAILGEVNYEKREKPVSRYWSDTYYLEGYISLAGFVENTMTIETFKKIDDPLFLGYYYKNEEEQDQVVSVQAMHDMFEEVSTPLSEKIKVAFPKAGNHVISSAFRSGDWQGVYETTASFLYEVMALPPVNQVIVDSLKYMPKY